MAAERLIDLIRTPSDTEFEAQDYLDAPAIGQVAGRLIHQCDELHELQFANIAYLWARDGGKSKGRVTLGKCTLATGFLHYFTHVDFVIWIAANHAREFNLSQDQLEALTYHELKHAMVEYDDDGVPHWKIRPHDVELFNDELRRYGAWTSDLKSTKEAFDQAVLPLMPTPFGGSF